MPAAAVVAGEYVHEDFPPVPPARTEAPAPRADVAPPLELDWSTDLVQVESDPRKAQVAQQPEREEAPVPRPKRERAPLPPVSEEPLVQIETQKPRETTPG